VGIFILNSKNKAKSFLEFIGKVFSDQNTEYCLRNCLAMWLRPRFMQFHATSCLVNNERVLLFIGSHILLRLKHIKRGSSYLPARPKSNSCYYSVNSGACLYCSLNSFCFFWKQWRHASTVRWIGFFFKISVVNWFHLHCSLECEQQLFLFFFKLV